MAAEPTQAPPDDETLAPEDAADEAYQEQADDGDFYLKSYALRTRRMGLLAEIVDGHGIAVTGAMAATHDLTADIDDVDVTSARNLMLIACYKAMASIAKES